MDQARNRARELVDANAVRYPDLLVEQIASATCEAQRFAGRCVFAEEMVVVALRMLKRAGALKPTTDDERAAVELAGYMLDVPAGNRRLTHPGVEPYVESVVQHQIGLWDGEVAA